MRFSRDINSEEEIYVSYESAISQLERYKLLMDAYVEQNCSITVTYKTDEIPTIITWLKSNWSSYVGVSFPPYVDTQEVYSYLPQEVVSAKVSEEYVAQLTPVDLDEVKGTHEIEDDEGLQGGCPVK